MFMTLDPYKCCHDSMKRKFQVKSLAKFAKCDERPEQLSLVKVAKKKCRSGRAFPREHIDFGMMWQLDETCDIWFI